MSEQEDSRIPRDQTSSDISPRLTHEEQRRGPATMAEARRRREEIRQERGGALFPPSWEIIEELRTAG